MNKTVSKRNRQKDSPTECGHGLAQDGTLPEEVFVGIGDEMGRQLAIPLSKK